MCECLHAMREILVPHKYHLNFSQIITNVVKYRGCGGGDGDSGNNSNNTR